MAEQRPDVLRVSDAERHQTSRRLQGACVEGYLTLEDFSQRVGRALAAQTRGELAELTQDLPARLPSTSNRPSPARPVSTMVLLSGVERTGLWRVAETSSLLVVLGSCKLDLRRATIAASLTTIQVRVVLGKLEVIVPHGVEVELDRRVADDGCEFAAFKRLLLSRLEKLPLSNGNLVKMRVHTFEVSVLSY